MTTKRIPCKWLFFAVAGVICNGCGPSPGQTKLIRLPFACQEVKFPEPWRIQDSFNKAIREVDFTESFELRRIGTDVAIAVKANTLRDSPKIFSEQKYRFRLRQPIALVRISDSEWSTAIPIFPSKTAPPSLELRIHVDENRDGKNKGFGYKGRRFEASGQYLTADNICCLLSPDERWVAIQSFDGRWRGSLLPDSGTFHIDVVNTSSGERQFTLMSHIAHEPIDPAFETHWLSDRYLFLDLFDKKEAIVLCDATIQDR